MSTLINTINNNYKKIILFLMLVLTLPLVNVIVDIIYAYGSIVGTYARIILNN